MENLRFVVLLDTKIKYFIPATLVCIFVIYHSTFVLRCITQTYEKPSSESAVEAQLSGLSLSSCAAGSFALKGFSGCRKILNCRQIQQIKRIHLLSNAYMKQVELGIWHGELVIINRLINNSFASDFQYGLRMLKLLGNGLHANRLLGYCNSRNVYITAYHKHGNAIGVHDIVRAMNVDSLVMRFSFCIDYVAILKYLHNHPLGTRVMCDSNSLKKTLSQYLITDDLHLMLNDLDALPLVRHSGAVKYIKCGRRQLFGDFVAPEQLWSYEYEFNDDEMPEYDEQTDIWKIPDVCDFFLGDTKDGDLLRYQLFSLHKQCKSTQPRHRPTAAKVLDEYVGLWQIADKRKRGLKALRCRL